MPLARIHCAVDPDDLVPLADCIACAEGPTPRNGRRCQFTGSILRAMYANDEERKDAGISATGLTGCLRQTALKLLYQYDDSPSKRWPALRGSLFHLIPEHYHAPHLICEVRFRKAYREGQCITGKMDEVDPVRRVLIDYKSTHTFPDPTDVRLGGFRESWVLQLNVYRWLLDGGTRLDTGEVVRIPIDTLGIVAFGMMEVRKYPVPALDPVWVEDYVRRRAGPIQAALDGGPWPACEYDPLTHVLCTDWCPVRDRCLQGP